MLIVSACGNEPSSSSAHGQPEVASSPKYRLKTDQSNIEAKSSKDEALAKPLATPKELTVAQLADGWRVVSVLMTEKTSGRSPDKSIKGAILEVYPEAISWSYKPEGATGLNDFCSEPVAGIIVQPAAIEGIRKEFAPALKRLALKKPGPRKLDSTETQRRQNEKMVIGHPHAWHCSGGGKFGPSDDKGADFLMLSSDTMLIRWSDDSLIYLERLNRPAPKTNMQSSDYQPDKR